MNVEDWEFKDFVKCYCESGRVIKRARELYAKLYPDRSVPTGINKEVLTVHLDVYNIQRYQNESKLKQKSADEETKKINSMSDKITIVYTKKLDEMRVFKQDMDSLSLKELNNSIDIESRPKFKTLVKRKHSVNIPSFDEMFRKLKAINTKLSDINYFYKDAQESNEEGFSMTDDFDPLLDDDQPPIKNIKTLPTPEDSSETIRPVNNSKTEQRPVNISKSVLVSRLVKNSNAAPTIVIDDESDSDDFSDEDIEPLSKISKKGTTSAIDTPNTSQYKKGDVHLYRRVFLSFICSYSNTIDLYYIELDGTITEYYNIVTANVSHKVTELAKYVGFIKTVLFKCCCWFKRHEFISLLRTIPEKSMAFMSKPHNCKYLSCNCCCNPKKGTNAQTQEKDVSVSSISDEPNSSIGTTNVNEDVEIILLEQQITDALKKLQDNSKTKKNKIVTGANKWLNELQNTISGSMTQINKQNTIFGTLINRSLLKPGTKLKKETENANKVDDISQHLKDRWTKGHIVMVVYNQKTKYTEVYEILQGNLTTSAVYLSIGPSLELKSKLADALYETYRHMDGDLNIIRTMIVPCCWFFREALIKHESHNIALNFTRQPHRCAIEECNCCCKSKDELKLVETAVAESLLKDRFVAPCIRNTPSTTSDSFLASIFAKERIQPKPKLNTEQDNQGSIAEITEELIEQLKAKNIKSHDVGVKAINKKSSQEFKTKNSPRENTSTIANISVKNAEALRTKKSAAQNIMIIPDVIEKYPEELKNKKYRALNVPTNPFSKQATTSNKVLEVGYSQETQTLTAKITDSSQVRPSGLFGNNEDNEITDLTTPPVSPTSPSGQSSITTTKTPTADKDAQPSSKVTLFSSNMSCTITTYSVNEKETSALNDSVGVDPLNIEDYSEDINTNENDSIDYYYTPEKVSTDTMEDDTDPLSLNIEVQEPPTEVMDDDTDPLSLGTPQNQNISESRSFRPEKLSIKNMPKPNITTTPKKSHVPPQNVNVDMLISTILDRFRNVRLFINDKGNVAADLNAPVGSLSTAELKVLANILAHAQDQVKSLSLRPGTVLNGEFKMAGQVKVISNMPGVSVESEPKLQPQNSDHLMLNNDPSTSSLLRTTSSQSKLQPKIGSTFSLRDQSGQSIPSANLSSNPQSSHQKIRIRPPEELVVPETAPKKVHPILQNLLNSPNMFLPSLPMLDVPVFIPVSNSGDIATNVTPTDTTNFESPPFHMPIIVPSSVKSVATIPLDDTVDTDSKTTQTVDYLPTKKRIRTYKPKVKENSAEAAKVKTHTTSTAASRNVSLVDVIEIED